jgi:hypothetical protein
MENTEDENTFQEPGNGPGRNTSFEQERTEKTESEPFVETKVAHPIPGGSAPAGQTLKILPVTGFSVSPVHSCFPPSFPAEKQARRSLRKSAGLRGQGKGPLKLLDAGSGFGGIAQAVGGGQTHGQGQKPGPREESDQEELHGRLGCKMNASMKKPRKRCF